jgi:penicillin V acylase-like amidase (Ntn superfamily)
MELGESPLPWGAWKSYPTNAKYAALLIGIRPLATEGMNLKGLTVSAHSFRSAKYPNVARPGKKSIRYLNFVTFILENFATCDEVAHALQVEFDVVELIGQENQPPSSEWKQFPGSNVKQDSYVHWSIQDAKGQSIVVEYTGGHLQLYNSSQTATMTNDPEYSWHVENLNHYASLGNKFVKPTVQINCDNNGRIEPAEIFQENESEENIPRIPTWKSHGLNLLGMPGDLSPSARFVRAFFLNKLALDQFPLKSIEEAFILVNHIINSVTIPRGTY